MTVTLFEGALQTGIPSPSFGPDVNEALFSSDLVYLPPFSLHLVSLNSKLHLFFCISTTFSNIIN